MDIKEEILKLTPSQRISLVQDIWDSISEDSIDLSDPIKEELDHRLKLHNEGKMDYLSLDEVREAMAKRK